MKRKIIFFVFAISLQTAAYAQTTFNGILDSTVSVSAIDNKVSYGVEEYANLRFQSRLLDNRAVVYGAVNVIAVAGDYARTLLLASPYSVMRGENYYAAIEIERLYFRLNFEYANFDGGLFRLPFGYSQVWGSSDFLNPKNPLKPDARPRGVLGTALSVFPKDDIKLLGFASTARNPFYNESDEILTGLSLEQHWGKASIQVLYSYELPNRQKDYFLLPSNPNKWYGIHRAGLSVKADVEVGIMLDALYTYNYVEETKWDGLSLSAGADYSFIDGKLIILAEYLYNGGNSSTTFSDTNQLGMPNKHYLYSGFTWLFNDFTNINIALISCFDKTMFMPLVTFNHDLFQGASLMIMAQTLLNNDVFDNGNYVVNCIARLRLRF